MLKRPVCDPCDQQPSKGQRSYQQSYMVFLSNPPQKSVGAWEGRQTPRRESEEERLGILWRETIANIQVVSWAWMGEAPSLTISETGLQQLWSCIAPCNSAQSITCQGGHPHRVQCLKQHYRPALHFLQDRGWVQSPKAQPRSQQI